MADGAPVTGNLEVAGDHDWFAIEIESDGNYQFNLDTLSISHADFVIRDSSGNSIQ